jgi:hypothetical protein
MSTIRLPGDTIDVILTPLEKLAALRGSLRIDRSQVVEAEVLPDGLSAARGLRAPGLAIPGRLKIGTWRGRGATRLVIVRRGVPTLRLRLIGAPVDTVLVSTPDAAAIAKALVAS